MNSLELQARTGTPLEYSRRQLGDIAGIEELVLLGSLARAAAIGTYEPGYIYSVADDVGDLRDFDISAIHGTGTANDLRSSVIWRGAHHVDVTQHFLLLGNGFIAGPSYNEAASRVLMRPLPGFSSVEPVIRSVDGIAVRTLPIGAQVVLDTVGSQVGKYCVDKQRFAGFAAIMRLRSDTPIEEFPSDRVIDEILHQTRWRGDGRRRAQRVFEPEFVS